MRNSIAVLALFITTMAYTQSGNYASSVGISGGYAEDGYGIMATFNYHVNRERYVQLSIFAAIAEDKG